MGHPPPGGREAPDHPGDRAVRVQDVHRLALEQPQQVLRALEGRDRMERAPPAHVRVGDALALDPAIARIAGCEGESDVEALGIQIVGELVDVQPGSAPERGRTRDEDEALFLEGLVPLVRRAESAGGRIFIEPLNRYQNDLCVTIADALRFAELLASPAALVVGDTFHMNIEEADMGAIASGRWVTDPSDAEGIRRYGKVVLVFRPDGTVTYSILESRRERVILMTYRVEGSEILTNQPSSPREERTPYILTSDGKLVLSYGATSIAFVRN